MWTRHQDEHKHDMGVSLTSSDVSACADNCLEVGVSYDGTSMKQGYSSYVCVGFVRVTMRRFFLDV